MSFGVHPTILIAIVGALLALVIAGARITRRGGVPTSMIVLALVLLIPTGFVFLAFHPELVDSRFSAYKRFYRDIQVGMTREQVLAVMEWRYPVGGPRGRPKIMEDTPKRLGFFMNPEASREPNCEGIFLSLYDGRVTTKEYLRD